MSAQKDREKGWRLYHTYTVMWYIHTHSMVKPHLTVWPWRSSAGVRSETQRYRGETWFPARPEWFQWFLHTPRSSQSGWTVRQNRPEAQDCTSSPTFHTWTGLAAPCWQHLMGKTNKQTKNGRGGIQQHVRQHKFTWFWQQRTLIWKIQAVLCKDTLEVFLIQPV